MQHNPYSAPAAAGPNVAPGGGLSTGSYEFNEYENATIAKMGARAWWWGLISAITGVIGLLMLGGVMAFLDELSAEGIEPHYVTLFVGALGPVVLTHLVIAFNYMGAGSSLKAVVNTQGNDVEHLMQSLRKLGTAFMVVSNINNAVVCTEVVGSLVNGTSGSLSCVLVEDVTGTCTDVAPGSINYGEFGPALVGPSAYYYWDASLDSHWPTHDPCGTNAPNHLMGITDPFGAVLLRPE